MHFVWKFEKNCVNFQLISVKFALFRTTFSSLGFCFVNVRPSIELGMCYLEDMQIRKNIATGLSGHNKLGWSPESYSANQGKNSIYIAQKNFVLFGLDFSS